MSIEKIDPRQPHARWIVISLAAALILLALLHVWGSLLVSSREKEWDGVSREAVRASLERASRLFAAAQADMKGAGERIAGDPAVRGVMGGGASRVPLFTFLERMYDETGFDVEVYNREGELLAWHGDAGRMSAEALAAARSSRAASVIDRTPMSSRLVVSESVTEGTSLAGWVVVSRLVTIDVPMQNALLRKRTLIDEINEGAGTPAAFAFGAASQGGEDGHALSAPLLDLEGKVFGSVLVEKPLRQDVLALLKNTFRVAEEIVVLVILCLLAFLLNSLSVVRRIPHVRLGMNVALLWAVRYYLVWRDLPSVVFDGQLFRQGAYASAFGYGLVRSPGDLFLTALAVAGSVLLIVKARLGSPDGPTRPGLSRIPGYALAAISTVLLFWTLRGFAAAIRSGVFDSSINYLDVRSVVPGLDQSIVFLSFLLIGTSFLALASVCTRWLVRMLSVPGITDAPGWMRVAGLYLLAALVFSRFTETPLASLGYQLSFALLLPVAVRWIYREGHERLSQWLFLFLLSGLLVYPLIDQFSRQKDRMHVEVLAGEQLQPVDGWLHHVVEEALGGLDTEENRARLSEGYGADVSGIAFRRWSTSLACSQGFDALFVVDDPMGNQASRFAIGSSVGIMGDVVREIPDGAGDTVIVREIGRGVTAVKVYAGVRSLRAPDGQLLGRARVAIAAGRQSFFRGETPGLLRGDAGPRTDAFYRQVFYSEYHDGTLLTSTNSSLPVNHQVADGVTSELLDSTRTSLWFEENIAGDACETFYVSRPGSRGDIVAVGMRSMGPAWFVVGLMKALFVIIAVPILVLLVHRLLRRRERGAVRKSFRGRLLVAMVITAIIPLTFVVVSVEIADRERSSEALRRLLEGEMQKVLFAITEHPQPGVTILSLPPSAAAVEDLASDIETDFNVYTDRDLKASSRQILYDAGFVDSRLDGSVYAKIVLGGERFVMHDEYLGMVRYTAGYRPILDARGDIIGVISVPTLFQPLEDENRIAGRLAFVFGAYASILVAVLMLAAFFSGRIAAPLQRLTAATRRVAGGDLDIALPPGGMEGEIGELTQAFDQMVGDLKKMRSEQARVERELAWKEMAQQIAHEIKNPLTPMRLSIQHLRRTWNDKVPDFGSLLESVTSTVLEQIDALSRIASEFSHFARMPRRNPVELDVKAVAEEAVHLFAQDQRVVIDIRGPASLPAVRADREELRRAFINVLRNGIQATEGTGLIVVSLEEKKGSVVVRIADSGRGIAPEILDRVFEPRFSTKTDGMGLGLAIVKKSIDDMGGSVSLESEVGKGTVVTFTLPALPAGGDLRG